MNKVPVNLINKLSNVVTEHAGEIVSSEAEATHIVNWNEEIDSLPEGITEDFIRILEVRGNSCGATVTAPDSDEANPTDLPTCQPKVQKALVHWWYYPDSYNEWLPGVELDANEPPDLAALQTPSGRRKRYFVCCRFVTDCALFNEWGNECDYEPEEDTSGDSTAGLGSAGVSIGGQLGLVSSDGPTTECTIGSQRKSQRGRKRLSNSVINASFLLPKPDVFNREAPVSGSLSGLEKLMMDAAPSSIQAIATANATVGIGSVTVDPSQNAPGRDNVSSGVGSSGCVEGGATTSSTKARETRPSWFSEDNVSDIERSALPVAVLGAVSSAATGSDCGSGSAIDSEYLSIRNAIISLYQEREKGSAPAGASGRVAVTRLSATDARKCIPGDVNKIMIVHSFLESYGLINHNNSLPNPSSRSSAMWKHPTCTSLCFPVAKRPRVSPSDEHSRYDTAFDTEVEKVLLDFLNAQPKSAVASMNPDAGNGARGLGKALLATVDWEAAADAVSSATGKRFTAVECATRLACAKMHSGSLNGGALHPWDVSAMNGLRNIILFLLSIYLISSQLFFFFCKLGWN